MYASVLKNLCAVNKYIWSLIPAVTIKAAYSAERNLSSDVSSSTLKEKEKLI